MLLGASRRYSRCVGWLYFRAMVREFRWTLLALALAVLLGALIYAPAVPQTTPGCPRMLRALYCAWMALLGEPAIGPDEWYLALLNGVYPLVGFVLIGEGIVHLALLMISRRQGEKEWMRVMASTYRDHIVLCGIGHLGFRVLEHLAASGLEVVVIEKDAQGRFVPGAKALGVPVLIRDMKEDQSLIDAGVAEARVIIIATDDDMANLEVALDARRLNPKIRVVMRLFDQQIAAKISGALMVDAAFSAAALAAPLVSALALGSKVLSSVLIGGVPHVTAEMSVATGSEMVGKSLGELEAEEGVHVLAYTGSDGQTESFPPPTRRIEGGDGLVVHCRASDLGRIAGAAGGNVVGVRGF